MEKKVILSIGLNDRDLHTQIIIDDVAKSIIARELANVGINGATLNYASGMWCGELEKTIQVTLYDVDFNAVKLAVNNLKVALNQQAIAVEIVRNVDVMFM